MEFNIQDQLIKGFEFGITQCSFTSEILISQASVKAAIFGIYYNNGVLTIRDNVLEGVFALSPSGLEAYIDDNKILKLK